MPSVVLNDPRHAPPLDTTVRLITPERVEFRYTLAGPFRRVLAYLLDLLIMGLILLVGVLISVLFTFGSPSGLGPILVIYFVLTWGYGGFTEAIFNGQTPGKKLMGIRVITIEGVPITGAHAAIRNLIGTLDGPLVFLYLTSLTSMVLTSRFQRLGDLAAGTMVIVEESRQSSKVPRVETAVVANLLLLLPLRVSAGSEMSRALADYVRHRHRFGRDRLEEISRSLASILRDRYSLPLDASSDSILCAFYHRLFLGE